MDIGDNVLISPITFQGLHKDYLKICELFLYEKIENGILGETHKTRDTKRAHVYHHNSRFFFKKISQYINQRVNFVFGYSKIKYLKPWLR